MTTRGAAPDVRVIVSSRGNAFMGDIASWLVEAATLTGRTAELVVDGLPAGDVPIELVVAPHELYPLCGRSPAEVRRAASIGIPVCTEQPGTPWFELTAAYGALAPAVLDINQHGVAALAARGIDAAWLRLGGVPSTDRRGGERDLDVLFLGGLTERRSRVLAELGPVLHGRPHELRLFSTRRPVHQGTPGLVFGDDKYRLLARSRLLVNVHRDDVAPAYFEWARVVEAMANGCVVVTEPSEGHDPLVAGEHFVETTDVAGTVAALLDDPDRVARISHAAATAVLDDHPLAAELDTHLTRLESVVRRPGPASAGTRTARRPVRRRRPALPTTEQPRRRRAFAPAAQLRLRTFHALMAETHLQRRIDRARCLLRHGADDVVRRWTSPSYESATPKVSTVVTLYDYAPVVLETLTSIAASVGVDHEVVVIDDHSTDEGREVVRRFAESRPDLPLLLLGSEVNRGLPAARNLAVAEARGEHVMIMDADNHVYPSCLRELAAALDADPEAAFAYAILEDFGVHRGIRSALGWSPAWLCDHNYIDAQAMFRRSTFERLGGYRTDDDLVHGWEDWELWLRLADAGEHGVHVPRILGRYRTQASSMVAVSNLAAGAMIDHIRGLHPGLPWPA